MKWRTPMTRFLTFEGYDGSGKSTLIDQIHAAWSSPTPLRVVGRKNEPQLRGISRAIETDDLRHSPEVEMMLRIALEKERGHIVRTAVTSGALVVCDRGIVSLVSWFDYLDVDRAPYRSIVSPIEDRYRDAVTIVCSADFDTCWSRIEDRPERSSKELLGPDANRLFFSQYQSNLDYYASKDFDIVLIDTVALSIDEAAGRAVEHLASRGLWPLD